MWYRCATRRNVEANGPRLRTGNTGYTRGLSCAVRGQSLVEFALIAPITILLLLAVIDIGALLSTKNSVAYASRQAGRLMEAYGNTSPDPNNPNASPDTYILNAITDTLRGSGLNLKNLRRVVFYKGPDENQTPNPNPAWTGDSNDDCVYSFTNGVAGTGIGNYCPGPTHPLARQDSEYAGVSIAYHYPGITPFYRNGVDFTDVTNVQIDPRSASGFVLPTPVAPPPLPATWTPVPAPSGSIVDVDPNGNPQALPSTSSIGLTGNGASDWAHWGVGAGGSTNNYFDDMSSGGSKISNLTTVTTGNGSPPTLQQCNLTSLPSFSWTDGSSNSSNGGTRSCVYVSHVGNGFKVAVPAGTTAHTLKLYVGALGATGQLNAQLSDGSALPFSSSPFSATSSAAAGVYTLTYNAASDGQTLTVTFTEVANSGGDDVGLIAATLT